MPRHTPRHGRPPHGWLPGAARSGWLAIGALTLGIGCDGVAGSGSSVCAEGLADAGATPLGDAGAEDGGAASCPVCPTVTSCGKVGDPAVASVTGVAASARHPHTYYLHNGPPDVARFFAVAQSGADLGTYQLSGVIALDWADVAVGPCPAGSCVFLADIGDPTQTRGQYTIYRVPEPTSLASGMTSVTADAFPFSYPDGSHDAAAILVHPSTRVVTILTRDHGGTGTIVYDLPSAQPGQPVTAIRRGAVGHLGSGVAVTAASARADGAILLRTTKGALLYAPPPADAGPVPPFANVLTSTPCTVPVPKETDGEAIAWMAPGHGYLVLDQGPGPAMDFVACPGL